MIKLIFMIVHGARVIFVEVTNAKLVLKPFRRDPP